MPIERYRITDPTIALFDEDGHRITHLVPAGAIITVDSVAFDEGTLVDATWDCRKVTMFSQDLRSRAELVNHTVCAQPQ
jgi:hypothetical protein